MKCPNKAHPDWQELVKLIGEDATWAAYISNGEEIPNPADYLDYVNYDLKVVAALNSDKVRQPSKNKEGFINDLIKQGVPKAQVDWVREKLSNINTKEALKLEILASYHQAITIAPTGKGQRMIAGEPFANRTEFDTWFNTQPENVTDLTFNNLLKEKGSWYFVAEDHQEGDEKTPISEAQAKEILGVTPAVFSPTIVKTNNTLKEEKVSTKHYISLSVPGGVKYQELEIGVPSIIPNIQGHAAFATKNGIGWVRADTEGIKKVKQVETVSDVFVDTFPLGNIQANRRETGWYFTDDRGVERRINDEEILNGFNLYLSDISGNQGGKTLRVLEIQSDLFQKGRTEKNLISSKGFVKGQKVLAPDNKVYRIKEYSAGTSTEYFPEENQFEEGEPTFLIMVDEAGEEVELVSQSDIDSLLILGENTEEVQNEFLQLLNKDNNWVTFFIKATVQDAAKKGYTKVRFPKGDTASKIEGHDIIGRYKTIWSFYENTIGSILKKQYKVEEVTDSYKNSWYEIAIPAKTNIFLSYPSANEAVEKAFQDVVVPGFTTDKQDQVTGHIVEEIMLDIRDTPGITFNQSIENFKKFAQAKVAAGNENYQPIIDNLPAFAKLAQERLERIGLLNKRKVDPRNTRNEGDEDTVLEESTHADTFYWADDWVFKFDAKNSASRNIKQFLAFIPVTDYKRGEYFEKLNYLGTVMYMPYDQVFEELRAILADVPNTKEAMEARLKEAALVKPWVTNLLFQLDSHPDDKEHLWIQFVHTFSATHNNFKTLLWDKDKGQFKFRLIDTDQDSVTRMQLNKWQNDFYDADLFEEDDYNIVPDKEKIAKKVAELEALKENPAGTKAFLNSIGIAIGDKTADLVINNTFLGLSFQEQFSSSRGLFRLIKHRLAGKDGTGLDLDEVVNPVINNSALRALAKIEGFHNPTLYSNSTRNGQNNVVYSYGFNKLLTAHKRKLADPNYIEALNKLPFNKVHYTDTKETKPLFKSWIHHLATKPDLFLDHFGVNVFDSVKESSETGSKLSQLGPVDLEMVKLQMFLKTNKITGLGETANFLFTVPSKTTSYVFNAPKTDVRLSATGSLNKDAKDALYAVALSEHNRIINSTGKKLKTNKYRNGHNKFYFFPFLNKETTPEIWSEVDGSLFLPTTKVGNVTVETIIRRKIEAVIKEDINKKIKNWEENGLVKNGALITDPVTGDTARNKQQVRQLAADYVINYSLFKFNMHQTFIGDPALYTKGDVETTWAEIGKRLAALIAPGSDLALYGGERFYSVKLKDRKGVLSLNAAQLHKRLKDAALPYDGINGTDAQEFVTWKEQLFVLFRMGKFDTATYNRLKDKLTKGEDLTKEELRLVFTPLKPVYTNLEIDEAEEAQILEYIKSSSIPLLPQFTKGLEIDKLRIAMEAIETDDMPVRAAFDSATKVGGIASVDIFDGANIKDNLDLSKYAKSLDRAGYRNQQDIPHDPDEEEVIKGTQPTKLLFDALLEVDGFDYKGKTYKGKDLKNVWNTLHRRMFELSSQELLAEIANVDGSTNIKEAQKLLMDEAIKSEYSPAELASLTLDASEKKFQYPFWALNSTKKFEAILTSLFTNNIVKQNMHGQALVLVSEEGMKGSSTGITYTKDYDPATGLKPYRINEETGEVLPGEILAPWTFKTEMSKFVDSAGFIDTSKLPAELLERFGFRIPNQGHNSMTLVKVVGFLEEGMDGIVVASRDLIVQMGSDFDVDKLYLYDYYTTEEGGTIRKEVIDNLKATKNDILDIHKAVLRNPKTFNSVVTPLSNSKDLPSAKELKKHKNLKITTDNYLSPDYDSNKYLEAVDGKIMVAMESLASTFNTSLQEVPDVYLTRFDFETKSWVRDYLVLGDESGNPVRYSDFNDPFNVKGDTKNSVISADQSAAVDNEKDPILYYLNSNIHIAPARLALRQLGVEPNLLNYLLNQPEIRNFVKEVQKIDRVIGKESGRKPRPEEIIDAAIRNLEEAYIGGFTEDQQVKRVALLNELKNKPINLKQLKQNLDTPNLATNLTTLYKFRKVYKAGKSLMQAQSAINIDSKGVGKSVLEITNRVARINNLHKAGYVNNLTAILGVWEADKMNPTTVSGYLIDNALVKADRTLNKGSELFHYQSRSFKKATQELEMFLGEQLTDKQITNLWDHYKSFLFAQKLEGRQNLFVGPKSLARRVKRFMTTQEGATNPFLIRLSFNTRGGHKTPDTISYQASKEEFVDELNIYRGFLELFTSPDEQTRQLAEDLVTYFYINGGIQRAKEWGKYIHPSILESYKGGEFMNYLKGINFSDTSLLGEGGEVTRFTKQFLQHHPWLLPKVTVGKFAKVEKTKLTLLPTTDPKSSPVSRMVDDEYPPIVAIEGRGLPKGNAVYKRVEVLEDGSYVYERINVLGKTGLIEYSSEEEASTITGTDYTKNRKVILSAEEKVLKATEEVEEAEETFNPVPPEEYIPAGLQEEMPPLPDEEPFETEETPIEFVNFNDTKTVIHPDFAAYEGASIKKSLDLVTSKKYEELVKVLKDIPYKGTLSFNHPRGKGARFYAENDVQEERITIDSFSHKVEDHLVHEVLHAATYYKFRSDKLTDDQKRAKANIIRIADNIRQRILDGEFVSKGYLPEEFRTFERLEALVHEGTATSKEYDTVVRLTDKYYAFSIRPYAASIEEAPDEFITNLFSRPAVRDFLNDIEWDGDKSLLDRLIELITQLLADFNVKKGSALEEAVRNAMVLIKEEPKVILSAEPKISKRASMVDRTRTDLPPINEFNSYPKGNQAKYQKIIDRYKDRIRFIERSISQAFNQKDIARGEQLKARLKEVQEEVVNFQENSVFEHLLDLGKRDLAKIAKILDQKTLSHNDINYSIRVLKMWENVPELILDDTDVLDNNQRTKDIEEISGQAIALSRRWQRIAKASLLEAVKAATGMEHLEKSVLDAMEKVDLISANTMDISRTGNILLSVMDKWMRDSTKRSVLEAKNLTEELDELVERLGKNNKFKKDGYMVFAQKTQEGQLTGELVRALKADYYIVRNSLLQKAKDAPNKKDAASAWKDYFSWMRQNHTFVDISKLFKEGNQGYVYSPDNAYLMELQATFKDRFDAILEEQKKKIEYYNERLNLYISTLDKDDPDTFRSIEKWKATYDPQIYINSVVQDDYKKVKIGDKFIKNEGHEFVVKRAKDMWQDEAYYDIQADPDLKAFYDYATTTLNRLYSFIPAGFKEGITTATIPSIAKTTMEIMGQDGFGAGFTKGWNDLIEAISVEDTPNTTAALQDPLTGKPELSLRVRYLNTLTPQERSYDLGKVIKVFALEALAFKHKSQVEDSIRLAHSIIEQAAEVARTPAGGNLYNRFAEKVTIKDSKYLKDQVEYAIESFYGRRKEAQGVTGKKVYTNKAKSKYNTVVKSLEQGKLTDEAYELLVNEMGMAPVSPAKRAKLGKQSLKNIKEYADNYLTRNTRYVAGSKLGDTILKYMQLKGMGFNVFSSVTNVSFGWLSNYNWAAGGRDFTIKDLRKANAIMLSSTLKSSTGVANAVAKKIQALMEKYDVLKEFNEYAHDPTSNANSVRKGMEKLSPYELQRRGEYFVQGMTMVAFMLNTKVTVDGKETSLWDAYDVNGKFKGDVKEAWEGDVDNKEHNKEYFAFSNRLDQINKAIHGNYDTNSPVRIKKGVLGRALMQFRSWMAEGVANRFEDKKYDLLLGRERKGRWRTYFDLGFSKSVSALLKTALGKDLVGFGNPEEQALIVENMKRNLMEVYQSLTLTALYLVLKSLDWDDDDDEYSRKMTTFTINQILRLQDDIEFYYSPMALENITQNAVPAFTIVRDSYRLLDAVWDGTLKGEWDYKGGNKRGENRILWTGAKVLPFTSTWSSLINKTENEEGFRK